MSVQRGCSKTGCGRPAVATLTYAYADKAVVLGPLATYAEPHTYDLCRDHAERLTPPRGWVIVRLAVDYDDAPEEADDLLALAEAVRERRSGHVDRSGRPGGPSAAPTGTRPADGTAQGAAARSAESRTTASLEAVSGVVESRRRGHLRVLRDGDPVAGTSLPAER